MEALFLGVGEACDPVEPNTSILVFDSKRRAGLLLDCGFTTAHQYFGQCSDPEELQGIWISHFHGDHIFGLPLLLLQMNAMKRAGEVHIYGPQGVTAKFDAIMEMAYPLCRKKFSFDVECVEMCSGDLASIGEFELSAALVDHSQPAMAVRVSCQGKALFYSGDGRPTASSVALAQDCDLVVHECYSFEDSIPGHCSSAHVVDFARAVKCKRLAVVHVNVLERRSNLAKIKDRLNQAAGDREWFVPQANDRLCF
nr:ribonuclease Z [Desulfobulbaceae bacterium]